MAYSQMTIQEFTQLLGSKAPVPGGGGASALAGAVGAALGNMVGSLTLGKRKYAEVEGEIADLMARADALREEFLALMDQDAEAFAPLARAYGMPKETEAQRAEKAIVMEAALKTACGAPLGIMEACCRTLDLLAVFAEKGSALAVSDAGVGAAMCRAALTGASLNIFINTKAMADRDAAQLLNARANAMLEASTLQADAIFSGVLEKLR